MTRNLIISFVILTVTIVAMVGLLLHTAPDEPVTSVIVQARDLETAVEAVRSVGGEITHELGVIRSVGANLTGEQLEALGGIAGLTFHDNRTVTTASVCTVTGHASLDISKNKVMCPNFVASCGSLRSLRVGACTASASAMSLAFMRTLIRALVS